MNLKHDMYKNRIRAHHYYVVGKIKPEGVLLFNKAMSIIHDTLRPTSTVTNALIAFNSVYNAQKVKNLSPYFMLAFEIVSDILVTERDTYENNNWSSTT